MAAPSKPAPERPDLDALIKASIKKTEMMPAHDYLSMLAVQRLSLTLAECVGDAQDVEPKKRLVRKDAAERLLDLYERALDGDYDRAMSVMAAGMLALLTPGDRSVLRRSIYDKRVFLDSVAVPA